MVRDKLFEAHVRAALEYVQVHEKFAETFLERLHARTAPLVCVMLVLLESPLGEGWSALRQAIVSQLAEFPHDAVSIFDLARAVAKWPPLETSVVQEGPGEALIFTATCMVNMRGRGPVSATATRSRRKEAIAWAAIALLAELAEVRAPADTADEDEAPPVVPPGDWTPERVAAFNRVPGAVAAAIGFATLGDTPAARWGAEFEAMGRPLSSYGRGAPSPDRLLSLPASREPNDVELAAMGSASRSLSIAKGDVPGPLRAERDPLAIGARDPISVLMEHAQKNHVKHPRFLFHARVEAAHVCTCSYLTRSAEGAGPTKQDAKRDACRKMLVEIAATENLA